MPHVRDILQSAAREHMVFCGPFNFSFIQNTKKCIFSALIVRIQNNQQLNGTQTTVTAGPFRSSLVAG